MWDFIISVVLPAIGTAAVGVMAWVVTNFVADPLLQFHRQRRAIHESLFFTANVGQGTNEADFNSAVDELRRHAARLDALRQTAPRLVQACFGRRGYDLELASRAIVGLSNNLRNRDEMKIERNDIEKALRFRRTYTDDQIKRITDRSS